MKFGLFCIPFLLALLPSPLTAQQPAGFSFSEDEQGVLVREGDQQVLFYQRAVKSEDEKYPRSHYVHPLYDLDGNVLSEDFPADHLHHRGIYWAWHQVWVGEKRAGDPWVCEDFVWDVQTVDTQVCDDGTAELRLRVHWKSPRIVDNRGEMTPLVDETAVIRIHPAKPDQRAIDFSFRLVPLVEQLKIGGSEDEKGYGGFCTRITLPHDLRFVSSGGEVQPQTLQVEAGPWMDMVGSYAIGSQNPGSTTKAEEVSGVAILTHPSLPGYVQPWILRERRSMQNAAWPGRQPVLLPRDQPLAFNYRLILHRGDSEAAKIAERHREFAAEAPRLASGTD
ncbi:DUF6807 family protein [Candidatus Laterigemmans baculatus]|uniref:DUF6807 family protein n=1 Tax=Candidatus Laterigemmans baculatus TaxID=2770505 RepID=UPI0013D9AEF6|nr:DUF6807 family protein [Candidatus Laterigemmans baculatus]